MARLNIIEASAKRIKTTESVITQDKATVTIYSNKTPFGLEYGSVIEISDYIIIHH